MIAQYTNEVERLKAGGLFWLGPIVRWHEVGPYQIAEYHPTNFDTHKVDRTTTDFTGFIDGREIGRGWSTLERAIVGLIAYRHDGSNSQAGEFFARMVNLPAQEAQP